MINNVVLVGRLTKDLELRYTTSNKAAVNFTLAVNRNFKNERGELQADFIGCTAYGKQAENMARFLNKGSLIGIEGRISTRNYQGKDGKTVYITEVIADKVNFLESKKQGNNNQQGYSEASNVTDFYDFNSEYNPFIEQ
jgi:single-stranded DNA-binding protein 3